MPNIFKVFQQGDEYFERISSPQQAGKYALQLFAMILLFSALYGIIMGSYNGFLQSMVTGIKIPVLIFLSIIICFPALFVVQFMIGSSMSLNQMINLILSGFLVFTTISLSFSTIVLFFMITGNNYNFIKLLHVAIFSFSGFFAMKTIISGLKFACEKKNVYPKIGLNIFRIWIFIFAFVSAQLAWNLRPFVGSKDMPFEWFRQKEGNFYLAVLNSFGDMFGREEESHHEPVMKKTETQSEQTDTVSNGE